MVVFTCGHCGESVNKPKVEKHYLTKCRNRSPNLSCMDCFKDFLGNEYESHTKCITEEERYSGKGFQAKEKKGEKKQSAWVEMLQDVLDEQKDASKNVLRIIETISKHNNTPRKKPKFINFVKNVCGHKTNPKDIDQAWDLISVKLAALSNNNNKQNGTEAKQNGDATNGNSDEKEEITNGDTKLDKTAKEVQSTNEDEKVNGDAEETKPEKLTKKQRKEEKKRKKYEAELQSAAEVQEENVEETKVEEVGKKGKKNRNKSESNSNEEVVETEGGKGKNKKRKRQDTVQSNVEVNDKIANIENEPVKPKETKKKPKTDEEIEAEALCLHDQNVANGEAAEKNGKFNWHSVIISVLQKKGNELPFKRLQKKVLSEYSEYTGDEVDDRIADKFIKKLKSAPNVRVDKNRVLLLED
ncbi:cell growth-regulating nucleolar protein [Aricia agestis]|uniref:cell growth-regulating nucleolar protein n=1 Tax=Aricia agestis TaxID=91739 RepID=UPI001C2022FA|nr:cell growth-regulating nucleolar protein [Aricia agestis]